MDINMDTSKKTRPAAVFSVSAILEGSGSSVSTEQWWRWSTNDDLGNENDWKLLGNAWKCVVTMIMKSYIFMVMNKNPWIFPEYPWVTCEMWEMAWFLVSRKDS